jgi:hypothetical protein
LSPARTQTAILASIGMMECWNIGIMGAKTAIDGKSTIWFADIDQMDKIF